MIAVPSSPAHLVMTSASPTRMPRMRRSRGQRATTAVLVTGRVTASVTSVCPPITSTPARRASRASSSAIRPICSGVASGGASSVTSRPTGSAPAAAASLQLTCTLSRPRCRSEADVIGSQENTARSPPRSSHAQSSPTCGACSDSGRVLANLCSTSRSSSSLSSFPSRINVLRSVQKRPLRPIPGRQVRALCPACCRRSRPPAHNPSFCSRCRPPGRPCAR